MKIFPSMISSNILNLEAVIQLVDPLVDGYHLDIMDDHFVPNLTWGPAFVNALRMITNKPFQIHLMVDNPASWIKRINHQPGDSFVFHAEAVTPTIAHEVLVAAKDAGWRAGIAINPATRVEQIGQHIALLDELLIMSVVPGFSGQGFIDTIAKADITRALAGQLGLPVPLIGMDGGIGVKNIGLVAAAGVEMVGIASAIFSGDIIKNIAHLRSAAHPQ